MYEMYTIKEIEFFKKYIPIILISPQLSLFDSAGNKNLVNPTSDNKILIPIIVRSAINLFLHVEFLIFSSSTLIR